LSEKGLNSLIPDGVSKSANRCDTIVRNAKKPKKPNTAIGGAPMIDPSGTRNIAVKENKRISISITIIANTNADPMLWDLPRWLINDTF